MTRPSHRAFLLHAARARIIGSVALAFVSASLACHSRPDPRAPDAASAKIPEVAGLVPTNLDTTKLILIPGSDGAMLYRTDIEIRFEPAVTDSARRAVLAREGLLVLGHHRIRDIYFVRMPDPGSSIDAYYAALARLDSVPEIRSALVLFHSGIRSVVDGRYPADGAGKRREDRFAKIPEVVGIYPITLDTTKVAVIPGPEKESLYRTDIQIAFPEGMSDSARAAFFDREGFVALGYHRARKIYFVRIPDPGSLEGLYAELKRLNDLPEVEVAVSISRSGRRQNVNVRIPEVGTASRNLDSTKLVTIPGPENAQLYRTDIEIRFHEFVTDSARRAFFSREGIIPLGYSPRRKIFFVRIPDPGLVVDSLYAATSRLRARPEVKHVVPILRSGMTGSVDARGRAN